MFDVFKTRAELANSEVHRFAAKSEALEFILWLLRKEGASDVPQFYAVWAEGSFLGGMDKRTLARELPGLKFDFDCDTAAKAKIGITEMDWAIANTGTLAQDSTQIQQRLASSLPLVHIALVATDRLVQNLQDFSRQVSPDRNAYLSLITGPSRTGDIEAVITIGAHGPQRVVIIFVDEWGGSC